MAMDISGKSAKHRLACPVGAGNGSGPSRRQPLSLACGVLGSNALLSLRRNDPHQPGRSAGHPGATGQLGGSCRDPAAKASVWGQARLPPGSCPSPVLSPAAQLELLNDVADLLKPVDVPLLFALVVRNDLQEAARKHQAGFVPSQNSAEDQTLSHEKDEASEACWAFRGPQGHPPDAPTVMAEPWRRKGWVGGFLTKARMEELCHPVELGTMVLQVAPENQSSSYARHKTTSVGDKQNVWRPILTREHFPFWKSEQDMWEAWGTPPWPVPKVGSIPGD